MRTKLTLVLIPVVVFIAATLLTGWFKGVRLQERYLGLRQQQGELRRLQAEHAQLRDRLTRAEAEAGRAASSPAGEQTADILRPAAPPVAPTFTLGEWTSSAAWRNEGRRTARATVATLLWAAAGGDVNTWRDALEFDDAAQRKARGLFAGVSPGVRSQYASAEDLVASVAMTKVPLTDAQLMWLRETDADHAIAGLRLAAADRPSNPVPAGSKATAIAPPQLPDLNREKMVVLTLHRSSTGWRVVVPALAIERMARELAVPLAKL